METNEFLLRQERTSTADEQQNWPTFNIEPTAPSSESLSPIAARTRSRSRSALAWTPGLGPPAQPQLSPPSSAYGDTESPLLGGPELLVDRFKRSGPSERRLLLQALSSVFDHSDLVYLSELIKPLMCRDFLTEMPPEIALQIIGYLDDPKDLVRCSQVSKRWRAIVADEHTWKALCEKVYRGGSARALSGLSTSNSYSAIQRGVFRRLANDYRQGGTHARAAYLFTNPDAMRMADALPPEAEGTGGPAPVRGLGLALTDAVATGQIPSGRSAEDGGRANEIGVQTHQLADMLEPLSLNNLGGMGAHAVERANLPLPSAFNTPSLNSPADPLDQASEDTAEEPARFSYKREFKQLFMTASSWLNGPGRVLSTQTSADDGAVTSLAFDTQWIVVAMNSRELHVFSASTGTYVRTLRGHEAGVWCLVLVSAGGGPVHPVSGDASPETRRTRRSSSVGPASPVAERRALPTSAPFARSGSTMSNLSAASNDSQSYSGRFQSTDQADSPLRSKHPRRPSSFSGLENKEREGQFGTQRSSDGPMGMGLGAGGNGGPVSQQNTACGTARGWGQPEALVISAGSDRDIRVWDVRSGTCLFRLRGHSSTIRCLRVLEGRPIAVSASRDHTLRVWDLRNGRCRRTLRGHTDSVRCIEVHDNKVASGSYDLSCKLWNVDTGECLFTFTGHIKQIFTIAYDGNHIATGSLDSTVRTYNAITGESIAALQGHILLVTQVLIKDSILVSGGHEGSIMVTDLTTEEKVHRLLAHDNSITSLQFDSRYLVTGSNDGHVKLFDLKTGQFIRDLIEPCDLVWKVAIRDDKCVVLYQKQGRTVLSLISFRASDSDL
ncbi:uncharacterized protein L969DRAFT_86828 [Mixia osmundae IAM 14324]|uniref:F-box domain-containing protein n=1 Tax=Mixia osmundae (strain CBS 9802 / IAM 14324 / JCM 22182 / KY 12970) TaxID=764103 RepID=G7E8V4_MIXOS|nr:uncharacterized protein L969DRAFT_86828 [Mixia osmundae IAM 14324]KEI40207.1 hypothetical protein L969DRAFT_86828 [Mixia osmundae IAM 14324]GAA99572.1 hypothetical protein E5Q_06273 [Mixia osmundae IAM 14324]